MRKKDLQRALERACTNGVVETEDGYLCTSEYLMMRYDEPEFLDSPFWLITPTDTVKIEGEVR